MDHSQHRPFQKLVQKFYDARESLKEQQQRAKGKASEKSPIEDSKPVVMQSGQLEELGNKIQEVGNEVRQLKANKAQKLEVDAKVQVLLSLKAEFKKLSGKDWQPTSAPPVAKQSNPHPPAQNSASVTDLDKSIQAQGDKVRKLKAEKASKETLEPEIKELLRLKAEYKAATGNEWKPGNPAVPPASGTGDISASGGAQELDKKIQAQGDKVRALKASKATKDVVDTEVKTLLQLKADYKAATGQEWKPAAVEKPSSSSGTKSSSQEKQKEQGDKAEEGRQAQARQRRARNQQRRRRALLHRRMDPRRSRASGWKPRRRKTFRTGTLRWGTSVSFITPVYVAANGHTAVTP
ncbi:hypothetical protein MRX96_028331 [Rhipicephalus microplus]